MFKRTLLTTSLLALIAATAIQAEEQVYKEEGTLLVDCKGKCRGKDKKIKEDKASPLLLTQNESCDGGQCEKPVSIASSDNKNDEGNAVA